MEGASSVTGVCAGCGASYRVPDAGRAYRCKKCGGEVRAARAAEPEAEPTGASGCAACHAVLPADSEFCPECGLAAGSAPRAAPRGADAREKRLASQDLRHVRSAVRIVRWGFGLCAVPFGIYLMLAIEALRDPAAEPSALLEVGMLAVLTALSVAGAILASVHPFACSVSIASLWSLLVVLSLTSGSFPGLLDLAMLVGLWLAVIPTVRAGRLLRAYPDMYVARQLLGTRDAHGADGAALHAAGVRRTRQRAAVFGGLVLGLSALAASGIWLQRPEPAPPPHLALSAFAEAWNRNDVAAVAGLFAPELRVREEARLRRLPETRGWTPWPKVEVDAALEAGVETPPASALSAALEHVFPLAGKRQHLSTHWRLAGRTWLLERLNLPPPALDGALTDFAAAWHSGDPDALAQLFPAEQRERMRPALERMEKRRGWDAAYPALRSHEVRNLGHDSAEVWFVLEDDRFRTRWRLDEDERWRLGSLDPPE